MCKISPKFCYYIRCLIILFEIQAYVACTGDILAEIESRAKSITV